VLVSKTYLVSKKMAKLRDKINKMKTFTLIKIKLMQKFRGGEQRR
jgi:hypothetical protein